MNRSTIAGFALLAGVAIAFPAAAAPAGSETSAEQAGSGAGMPPMGMHGMGHHPGMMGHGGMHGMTRLSPQQRCEERLARRAAQIAYTVAKLKLTAEQRPLWDKVNTTIDTAREREMQLCAALKPAGQGGTVLDRMSRREQFLTVRLQAVQQVKPALEQLYQALTPEQKAVIDHPFRRG